MIQSPAPSNRFVVFNADLPSLAFDTLLWYPGASHPLALPSSAPRAILVVKMFPLFLECNSLSLLKTVSDSKMFPVRLRPPPLWGIMILNCCLHPQKPQSSLECEFRPPPSKQNAEHRAKLSASHLPTLHPPTTSTSSAASWLISLATAPMQAFQLSSPH